MFIYLYYDTGKNVALHKAAMHHPGTYIDFKEPFFATYAVDGDTRPLWQSVCSSTTLGSVDDPAWWRVDLKESYRIVGIKIYNRDRVGKLPFSYNKNIYSMAKDYNPLHRFV